MDNRQPLAKDYVLILDGSKYSILELIGFGGNSFVYSARHNDNLLPEKTHTVLIKELFPQNDTSIVKRNDNGQIEVADNALNWFEGQKESFKRGHAAHLDFANHRADMASVNIGAYEANGTLYTILGNSDGKTLKSLAQRGEIVGSLTQVVMILIKTLDALEVFHQQNLLHLDISPDNILLMSPSGGRTGHRVILIDYNSIWSLDDLKESRAVSFNSKNDYAAPEVRNPKADEVSAASDLFSICAIFLEYLRGEPMNFAALHRGEKTTDERMALLDHVSTAASSKAVAIVRKGLQQPPRRRYQSVSELRLDFVDLLQELTGSRRKRIAAITVGAALIVFAVLFTVFSNVTMSYPSGEREIYTVQNTMTALGKCLSELGLQIDADVNFLESDGSSSPLILPPTKVNWSADELITALGSRSPIPNEILRELLDTPEQYAQWSADMRESVAHITDVDSLYPEADRSKVLNLYAEYIASYRDIVFIKTQLVLAPLNEDGTKPLLDMLPKMYIFSEQFLQNPFVTDKNVLENELETKMRLQKFIVLELNGYGI